MRAQVHDQVDVFKIFEKVQQSDDVLMVHLLLYPHFTLELGLAVPHMALTSRISRRKVRL